MKNRYQHIDFLRATAIIGMMAIHIFYYHSSDNLYSFLWNYLHFVVVLFVFCSGYVLTARYKNYFKNLQIIFLWYKKRFSRLLIPFYVYLIIHYLLWFIFPKYFNGLGLNKNFSFIAKSMFLTGGVDLNWLPLLFIQLTVLFPFFIYAVKKRSLLFLSVFFPIVTAFYFIGAYFPNNSYRLVMWLPWSIVLLLSILFYLYESRRKTAVAGFKKYLALALIGMTFFSLIFFIGNQSGKSFILTKHKYPPDVYYLSYGFIFIFVFLAIGEINLFKKDFFTKIIKYISKYSYQLFFIQQIVLDFILKVTDKGSFWARPMVHFILIFAVSLSVNHFFLQVKKILFQ